MKYTAIDNRKDQSFYQENMEIRFGQCDATHRLKLSELFKILTDMADMAFEFRGMDHQFLMEREIVFLISRFSVLIHRMPEQTEHIRVATWEQEIERAQFWRNFCIWDENGKVLVEAASGWVLVNPNTRAILRPAQFEERFPGFLLPMPEETSGAPAFKRLRLSEIDPAVTRLDERKIVYSDIDGNGHVDNALFVAMAVDQLPETLSSRPPKAVQVVFNREAVLGEKLEMYLRLDGSTAVVKGMSHGKDNFICEIEF